jgi:hypothetical protein
MSSRVRDGLIFVMEAALIYARLVALAGELSQPACQGSTG